MTDDVNFRAPGGFGYSGNALVFVVAGAFAMPIIAIVVVLYMLPRVTGVEEMRLLRKELAESREQTGRLTESVDKLTERMNRTEDSTRNRFEEHEVRIQKLER
jgi:hypothetical protein